MINIDKDWLCYIPGKEQILDYISTTYILFVEAVNSGWRFPVLKKTSNYRMNITKESTP